MTPLPDATNAAGADLTALTLARMEGKLDAALQKISEHDNRFDRTENKVDNRFSGHDSQIAALSTRVTILEASRPKNVPVWAGVALSGLAVVVAVFAIILR